MVRPAESSPSITRPWRLQHKGVKKSDDEDDHDKKPTNFLTHPWNVTASVLPQLTGWALKTMLGVTVALYILNQQHALPRPLSAVVSKALFWPTLPITACRRIGKWITPIDDTVVIGGAPFGFLQIPEKLYKEYGVRIFYIMSRCCDFLGMCRHCIQTLMLVVFLSISRCVV
jgi:hypothetical protein